MAKPALESHERRNLRRMTDAHGRPWSPMFTGRWDRISVAGARSSPGSGGFLKIEIWLPGGAIMSRCVCVKIMQTNLARQITSCGRKRRDTRINVLGRVQNNCDNFK